MHLKGKRIEIDLHDDTLPYIIIDFNSLFSCKRFWTGFTSIIYGFPLSYESSYDVY